MIPDGIELWIGLLFLAVGIGFGWGRRHGRRDGFLEGVRFAPLELRRASLERANCIICGRGAHETNEKEPADVQQDTVNELDGPQLTGGDPETTSPSSRA